MFADSATHRRSTTGCGGCLCFAFFLMLFATSSPYWLWQRYYSFSGVTSTVASGSFVVSSTSKAWRCGWWTTCVGSAQWNFVSDFNSTICQGTLFTEVGQYGFCTAEGGQVQTPSSIKSIQALSVTTTVVLFLASILALAAPAAGGSKASRSAAFLSLVAAVLSCSAFSVAASYEWYQTFFSTKGGSLPFVTASLNCGGQPCLFVNENVHMYWGPAFWSTVLVFVITFLATGALCATSARLDDDGELDGSYGMGGSNNPSEYAYGEAGDLYGGSKYA